MALIQQNRNGFTLVEVLVALAVLAIALPALMISISEQVRGFSHMRDKSIAHWVAMNKMTELRLQNKHQDYLPKDRKRGSLEMLGREWFWELDTEKTANELLLEVELKIKVAQDSDAPALATALNYFVLPIPKPTATPDA
ncbi:MAG: type II secretion system minor pseudopilin GspI [Pseudomonadota bacterium]